MYYQQQRAPDPCCGWLEEEKDMDIVSLSEAVGWTYRRFDVRRKLSRDPPGVVGLSTSQKEWPDTTALRFERRLFHLNEC